MAYEPDYSKIRMTVTPALSESVSFVQGYHVKNTYWSGRTLPALGRGSDVLFFSSSAGVVNVSDARYFDDSIVGKLVVTGESLQAEISADQGRLETRFGYNYEGFTMGVSDADPVRTDPYRDKEYFNPVQYIKNPDAMTWPVVLEDPAAIDHLDLNGVLEPLTIRSVIGMSSLFVGDHLDPEPHCTRGALGGKYAEEPYARYNLITEYYEPNDTNRNYPFNYVVDHRIYSGFSEYIPDSTYTDNDNEKIRPFVESTQNEKVFAKVQDTQIKDYLVHNVLTSSMDSRPTPNSKVTGCGFIYDNTTFGTDSIAYGGLVK